MNRFTVGGKSVSVFPSPKSGAPVIYLNTFAKEGEQVLDQVKKICDLSFTLVEISDLDWGKDMSPWDCPPLFKNAAPCTGGADTYLELLTREILPTAERELIAVPSWRAIAGYSLGGLFALYALYQTELFHRAASISGSLWFPGIREYLFSHQPKRTPDCLYFSLGDKESHTRNPFFSQVEQNTREISAYFQSCGIETMFQLNAGDHNDHPTERTAAGLGWLLKR